VFKRGEHSWALLRWDSLRDSCARNPSIAIDYLELAADERNSACEGRSHATRKLSDAPVSGSSSSGNIHRKRERVIDHIRSEGSFGSAREALIEVGHVRAPRRTRLLLTLPSRVQRSTTRFPVFLHWNRRRCILASSSDCAASDLGCLVQILSTIAEFGQRRCINE
jgi:hypothetical protein